VIDISNNFSQQEPTPPKLKLPFLEKEIPVEYIVKSAHNEDEDGSGDEGTTPSKETERNQEDEAAVVMEEEGAVDKSEDKKEEEEDKNEDKKEEEGDSATKKPSRRDKQRERHKDRKKKRQMQEEFEAGYVDWVPPQNQTGDGKISLNAKFGY